MRGQDKHSLMLLGRRNFKKEKKRNWKTPDTIVPLVALQQPKAIPRMLAPWFAQNFLQLFFENHTQIQCFDVKITTKHLFL